MASIGKNVPSQWVNRFNSWRSDAWENALTGLGVIGKDKRKSSLAKYRRLVKREIEDVYACDDMYSKIVDTPPEDMMREGFVINIKDQDQTIDDGIQAYLDERNGKSALQTGLNWARLYGGSGIILGINDGREPEEPVDENNIISIDFLNPMDRYELEPLKIQTDPIEKRFGLPELYRLQPSFGNRGGTVNLHWTRILRFDGAILPRDLFVENNYWHAPILQKTINAISNFQTSHDSVAAIMQDFAQAVFKINGLSDIISQGNDDLLQKRLAMIDTMRSVVKAVVIEEGEEFERKMTSLAGVKDVLTMINQRLVAASDGIPHTILLGESPSGLGATGESEIRDYFDNIARKQEKLFKPELERLIKYIFISGDGPTRGEEPQDWQIQFNPLFQLSEKETVDMREKQSITDERYILNGVLSNEEVRQSRFGGTDFSLETSLLTPELENRTLNVPQGTSPTDVIEDALLNTRVKAGSHTHRDIDNRFISPPIQGMEGGKHWHIGPQGEMFSEEPDGPNHTHKSIATGFITDEPSELNERPDLKEDNIKNKYEDVIEKQGETFIVKSKKGKVLGKFKSKEQAEKRLREIEFFKRGEDK